MDVVHEEKDIHFENRNKGKQHKQKTNSLAKLDGQSIRHIA